MIEMVLLSATILVVIALIALTYWAVVTKEYPNPLDEIQHLSDLAAELVETAAIYREHGMEEEANAALDEAARLNTKVWEVINGA